MAKEYLAWVPDQDETIAEGVTVLGCHRHSSAAEQAAEEYEWEDDITMNVAVQEVENNPGQAPLGEVKLFEVLREWDPLYSATPMEAL